MRRTSVLFLPLRRSLMLALFLLCTAATAGAAPLPVDGTLSFTFAWSELDTTSGPNGTLSVTGSGMGDSDGGLGSAAAVPAGLFSGTTTLSFPIAPPSLNLSKITVSPPFANSAGSFAPGGAMGNSIVAGFLFTSGAAAGTVPLHYVGGGGTGMGLLAGLPVTVVGATWTNLGITPGDPTRTIQFEKFSVPFVTATAFDKRTAGGAGTVQLVAPAIVKLFGGGLGSFPIVGTLTLSFVPEPGLLVLIGTGVVGLAACGRRRRTA